MTMINGIDRIYYHDHTTHPKYPSSDNKCTTAFKYQFTGVIFDKNKGVKQTKKIENPVNS